MGKFADRYKIVSFFERIECFEGDYLVTLQLF